MAGYSGMILTTAGMNLQAQAQLGGKLIITRIGVGDGLLSEGESYDSLTALKNQVMSLGVQDMVVTGTGQSRIRALLTNDSLTAGFFVREIGIFAKIGDNGTETLYSYTNAGSTADYLPAAGVNAVEEVIEVFVVVGNAQNVTAEINDRVTLATREDVQGKSAMSDRNTVLMGNVDTKGNAAALYSDLTSGSITLKKDTLLSFANGCNELGAYNYLEKTPADLVAALTASDENTIPLQYTANLCSGGTGISGGNYSSRPISNAFDGITATSWASSQLGAAVPGAAWIGYNFTTPKAILRMRILQADGSAGVQYATSVIVQVSTGDDMWLTTVGTFQVSPGDNYISLPAVGSWRSWRIIANSNMDDSKYWSVRILEMMEALQTHYLLADRSSNGTVSLISSKQKPRQGSFDSTAIYTDDLCSGGTAISGGDRSGVTPEMAFNNRRCYNCWASAQTGAEVIGRAWIGYKFPVARQIKKIIVNTVGIGGSNCSSVLLQNSADGSNWITQSTLPVVEDSVNTYYVSAASAASYWRLLANVEPRGGKDYHMAICNITMHELSTDINHYDLTAGISRHYDGTSWTQVQRVAIGEATVDSSGIITSYTNYPYGLVNYLRASKIVADDIRIPAATAADQPVNLGQFVYSSPLDSTWGGGQKVIKLPGGLKMQVFRAVDETSGGTAGIRSNNFSFPESFNKNVLFINGSIIGAASPASYYGSPKTIGNVSLTGGTVVWNRDIGPSGSLYVTILAIGE